MNYFKQVLNLHFWLERFISSLKICDMTLNLLSNTWNMDPLLNSWTQKTVKKCVVTRELIPNEVKTISSAGSIVATVFDAHGIMFIDWRNFLWKKECFHSAGYRPQVLSITGRMLCHLSYGGSTTFLTETC